MRCRSRRAAGALGLGLLMLSTGVVVGLATPAAAEEYRVPANRIFAVDGRGFGHGRGMSQWGAQGAAVLGRSSETILATYYPGTLSTPTPEDPARLLRVVLTGAGVEGRKPISGQASTDRRYECDSAGPAACDLEVLPMSGLAVRNGGGGWTTLPSTVAVSGGSATVDRWAVTNDDAGLHLRALAAGAWRDYALDGSTSQAGPLRFGGPGVVRMRYRDGTVREYRGEVSAVRTSGTTMARVNTVPREEYLRSVVPKEVSPGWLGAALQAQAVAARTFAEQARSTRSTGATWDLCDSTFCQVYAGRTVAAPGGSPVLVESASTDAAISVTRDLVRTFNGTIIRAEFSASNGGWSVAGGTSWLPARRDDWDGVVGNPPNNSHTWSGTLPASALESRFPVGRLTALIVRSRDGNGEWGGRVLDVELRGVAADGSPTSVQTTGEAVRSAFSFAAGNPSGLRSSWWKLQAVPQGELTGAWSGAVGQVDLAWRQPDRQVAVGRFTPESGLSGQLLLGGGAQGGPVLAGRSSGWLEVFVRGTDNQLWTSGRPASGSFGAWQPLGGVLSGRPAVATFLNSELHVFVAGTNGGLWHRWSVTPGQWSAWESLGGRLAPDSGPAAVSVSPGRLDVVVQGTDQQAWLLSYAGGWGAWTPLGGRMQGDPAVASASGELTVAVLGDGQEPYTRIVTGPGAGGWRGLGGRLAASPGAAASPGGGRVDLVGTGTDGGFYVNSRSTSGWSGWRQLS